MSGSDGRIVLSAAMPGVAFTIVDGTFQAVARGVGTLDVTLLHGLYEIATRAGGSVETQLISLEPGEVWRREGITAGVYGAAPLPGSRTANAMHAAAAESASRWVAAEPGPPSGLVVVVRRLEPGGSELHHEQLILLDRELRPVPEWIWTADQGAGIATASHRLEPGPYVLRLRQPKGHGPQLDQTVWLSEGWQTLVFCPNGPERPAVEDSSVHMCRLTDAFPGANAGLAAAVEIATSGLRQGLPLVNADLLELLREQDFANPMLGITGAHALLLQPELGDYCAVVAELRTLLPEHPDVIALATHPSCAPAGLPPVSWPPMLGASYDRLLLPADRLDPDVILDGSVAERVAGYVVQRGPWLCWEASPSVLRPAPVPALPAAAVDEPTKLLSATTVGATRRVQRHVRELAGLTGNSQHQVAGALGADELARRLDLPIATVRAVLVELGWDKILLDTPPVPPDGSVEEEKLEPVPRGGSPFAPDTVEEKPPPDEPPGDEGGPGESRAPVGAGRRGRRRWRLGAAVLTALVVLLAVAWFYGGSGGSGGVSIGVPVQQPGLFARATPSDRTVDVTLSGNDEPQQVTARVEGAGFRADGSRCAAAAAGRSCPVRVSYRPDPKRLRDYRATLVLGTADARELRVPLYGAAKPARGEVTILWRQVHPVRSGEALTPYVEVRNVRLGPVQTVLTISIPAGFELGTFADVCDTRRVRVVYCWVGLDEHHTLWPIHVPLIARGTTSGTLRVTAQLSVDPDFPDDNRADNTATVTIPVDSG